MSKLKQYQCRVLISTDLVRPSPLSAHLPSITNVPAFTSVCDNRPLIMRVFPPLDFQRYRCRQGQPGDKSGPATGLGDIYASNWTSWPLWLVST